MGVANIDIFKRLDDSDRKLIMGALVVMSVGGHILVRMSVIEKLTRIDKFSAISSIE